MANLMGIAGRGTGVKTGFTLIELLIVIAIVAILAAIAYPSYQEQIRKSRRTDATGSLARLATQLEKYAYDNNGSFSGATVEDLMGSEDSPEGFYTVSMLTLTSDTYEIRAAPVAGTSQAGDSQCQTFILSSTGVRDVTGSCSSAVDDCVDRCW
ncbi:type IV pilin protein [Thiorhodococcus minor]|uniref:Prepilin-type N-terminal cleavage/methylation domain-containing protein n=1 Tax=Thiorhodococcus minor TaxID=57489 RepID=A0A6M0K5H6_9GAMM|nr:type IV pilin protein [Thiorhodococcus minor]NEV65012.1 prepilin-type N-terminal cleavage/methylation domain-containing protein [Thiorhodococcus minor]